MVVYVVLEILEDNAIDFRGAFSTRALANAYIEEQSKYYNFGHFVIEEEELDSH